jgi:hypothetical protein
MLSPNLVTLYAVIPAKAGIHSSASVLVGKWIPAFAGMTA